MQNTELIPDKDLEAIAAYIKEVKQLSGSLLQLAKDAATVRMPSFNSGKDAATVAQQVEAAERQVTATINEQVKARERAVVKVRELTQAEAIAKEQARQHNAEMKLTAKETLAAANSVDALRVKVSQLAATWGGLDMNSEEFQQVGKELAEMRAQVTAAEMSVGQFGRNVGNYAPA